jgi:hypothetical protein
MLMFVLCVWRCFLLQGKRDFAFELPLLIQLAIPRFTKYEYTQVLQHGNQYGHQYEIK